jgi:UDP-glucose 4-epimerase
VPSPYTVIGTNSRCFTHVSDAVRALVGLMQKESVVGEVFNIGSTQEITILDLAERVRRMVGSSSEIVFVPYSVAYEDNFEDMPRRIPALEKIQRTIGWQPEISLDGILESVIEYNQNTVLRPV